MQVLLDSDNKHFGLNLHELTAAQVDIIAAAKMPPLTQERLHRAWMLDIAKKD
jgi:hypothetical protein